MIRINRFFILHFQVFKIVLFLMFLFVAGRGNAQGLQFNSNDSLLAKRTSYSVFKNDQPTFHNHLRINFDLSLWDNEHLGYILNISDDKNNSYSLSSIHFNNAPYLNFNIDSKRNVITINELDGIYETNLFWNAFRVSSTPSEDYTIRRKCQTVRKTAIDFNYVLI